MRYLYLILAIIILTTGIMKLQEADRDLGLGSMSWHLQENRKQMAAIAGYVRNYAKVNGHYPTNDDGLLAVKKLASSSGRSGTDKRLSHCRITSSGALTVWGDPFIYENRLGLDAARFADSGATRDKQRKFSFEIDKGIYIWSIAAEQENQEYSYWHLRLSIIACGIILAASFFFALFARIQFRTLDPQLKGFSRTLMGMLSASPGVLGSLFISFFASVFLFPIFMGTCYRMSISYLYQRSPEINKGYISLIRKYKDRGIISDKAYRKIVKGLEKDLTDQNYYQR